MKRNHLAKVPYESFDMDRDSLLSNEIEMTYGPCRWCGQTHAIEVIDGVLRVDGVEVDRLT